MTIFERLLHQALGNRPNYTHKNGKENIQVTKLQDFLDTARN